MRGVANNLGAEDTGEICAEIEGSLTSGDTVSQAAIATLAESLAILDRSIGQLVNGQSPSQQSGNLDRTTVTELIKRLAEEIADSNPAAADTAELLLEGLADGMAGKAQLQAVGEGLDIFDFASAVQHLEAAKSAMAWTA